MQTEKETQVCTEFEPLSPGCQLRWMVTGYIPHKHDTENVVRQGNRHLNYD